MKAKKLLVAGFAVLTLGLTSCTNPIGLATDYARHGSRKAKESDYKSFEGIKDFKKQVKVADNYVKVGVGEYDDKIYSHSPDGKPTSRIEKMPEIVYMYKDFDEDGHVDEYGASNRKEGMTIVNIHSKVVWDAIYEPTRWSFNDSQKYAGKKLQETINADYALLREEGTKVGGKAFPPGGTWFKPEEYPIKMGEKPLVEITIEAE